MAAGRKSTSQRLNEAGHKPKSKRAITGRTPPPDAIKNDPVASDVWRRVVAILNHAGLLQDADAFAIQRYAVACSVIEAATPAMLAGKWSEKSKTGWTQPSANLQIFEKSCRLCLALEKSLGLSPDSRRLAKQVASEPAADELTEFLSVYEG